MKKETYNEVSTQDLRDRLAEMEKDYAQPRQDYTCP